MGTMGTVGPVRTMGTVRPVRTMGTVLGTTLRTGTACLLGILQRTLGDVALVHVQNTRSVLVEARQVIPFVALSHAATIAEVHESRQGAAVAWPATTKSTILSNGCDYGSPREGAKHPKRRETRPFSPTRQRVDVQGQAARLRGWRRRTTQ